MLKECPAWIVYSGDEILAKRFTFAGGYQCFKNAVRDAKASGTDKQIRLVKGTLANTGGTQWDLIQETAEQILP